MNLVGHEAKLCIAMALKPPLLIADEPTIMDTCSSYAIMNQLCLCVEYGSTLILISHISVLLRNGVINWQSWMMAVSKNMENIYIFIINIKNGKNSS